MRNRYILAILMVFGSLLPSYAGSERNFNKLHVIARYVKNPRVRRALLREIEILRKKVLINEIQGISLDVCKEIELWSE